MAPSAKKTKTANKDKTKKDKKDITKIKAGGVKRRPLSKKTLLGNKSARKAIAKGEVANLTQERVQMRDHKTLYLRFKADKKPTDVKQIEKLHPDIVAVRVQRQARRKAKTGPIRYCFVEFDSEANCEKAKVDLSTKIFNDGRIDVDFVGQKSAKGGKKKDKVQMAINPLRLFVSGVPNNSNAKQMKKLFPGCKEVIIPDKSKINGKNYAFVHFTTPAAAKEAFDKETVMAGKPLTVLYAKMAKKPGKRAHDKEESAKTKKAKLKESGESEEDEEMENDEESGEEGEEEEGDEEESDEEEVENDEDSDDDEEDE